MQKRPFVLLEILIAFMLVAICAIPLIEQPLWFFRKEVSSFEKLEKERLADWTFTEIKELLLKNEIPWDKLPSRGVTTAPFSLPPATLQIPGAKPKQIKRRFTLFCKGEKIGRNDEIFRILYVTVNLNDEIPAYEFRIPVQRIVEKKQEKGHSSL